MDARKLSGLALLVFAVGAGAQAPEQPAAPAEGPHKPGPAAVQTFQTRATGRARVALAPDGKTLAAGGGYGTVRLWDTTTGKERPLLQELGAGWVNALAFTRDGKTLLTAGEDKTVRLWDLATGRVARRLEVAEGVADAVSISPDGKTLAVAGRQLGKAPGGIHTWDLATGRPLRSFGPGRSLWVIDLPFTPDSKYVASGGEGFTASLWEVATGKEVRRFEHPRPPAGPLSRRARKLDLVLALALAPDGKTLATADNAGVIRLWEITTGKERRQIKTGTAGRFGFFAVCSLAYSPDGRTLASAGGDRIVRLWDAATGKERRRLVGHTDTVWSLAFAPDGRLLASAAADATARLWTLPAP